MRLEAGDSYVALGSSFAAGPGLQPRAPGSPRFSGRSAANYAHLFAERRGLDLRDMTYSGATTSDLLHPDTHGHPAQVDAVRPVTRLITVTAGGNDVGYLPALTLSSLPRPLRVPFHSKRRITDLTNPATEDQRFTALHANLTSLVQVLKQKAPSAEIILTDYLTIVPAAATHGSGPDLHVRLLTSDLISWARTCAAHLSKTLEAVAVAEGCHYLAVSDASHEHHAWAPDPWTRQFHLTLRGGAAYHPNAAGMRAVADLLDTFLTGQPHPPERTP